MGWRELIHANSTDADEHAAAIETALDRYAAAAQNYGATSSVYYRARMDAERAELRRLLGIGPTSAQRQPEP